jgi:hypothetical protein
MASALWTAAPVPVMVYRITHLNSKFQQTVVITTHPITIITTRISTTVHSTVSWAMMLIISGRQAWDIT